MKLAWICGVTRLSKPSESKATSLARMLLTIDYGNSNSEEAFYMKGTGITARSLDADGTPLDRLVIVVHEDTAHLRQFPQ